MCSSDLYRWWMNLGDARRQIVVDSPAATQAYRQAIALGERRLTINPNDAQAYQYLAMARFHLGEGKAGRRDMDRALALAPKNAEILFWDALTRAQAGDLQGSLDALERALDAGVSIKLVEADPDLADLAKVERYQSIVRRYREAPEVQR